jgi:hypothetical protein
MAENEVKIVIKGESGEAVDALKRSRKAVDDLKQGVVENNERIKAARDLHAAYGDANTKTAEQVAKLTGVKKALTQAFQGLNNALPGVGTGLRMLLNPYTAVAAAAGYLIKKNLELRQEYKTFLEEADREFTSYLAKTEAAIIRHKESINQLKDSLLNCGSAARDLGRDLEDSLSFTSAEESAQMEVLAGEEALASAQAEGQFSNDPAALAIRRAAIKVDFAKRRQSLRSGFSAQRTALKEGTLAQIAAEEPLAKQRAVDLATNLGTRPDPVAQMQSYDALIAAAEENLKNAPLSETYDASKRVWELKRNRPAVQAEFLRKAAAWDQSSAEAKRASGYAESLTTRRQSLERELDRDRITGQYIAPLGQQAAALQNRVVGVETRNTLNQQAADLQANLAKLNDSARKAALAFQSLDPKVFDDMADIGKRLAEIQRRLRQQLPGE